MRNQHLAIVFLIFFAVSAATAADAPELTNTVEVGNFRVAYPDGCSETPSCCIRPN